MGKSYANCVIYTTIQTVLIEVSYAGAPHSLTDFFAHANLLFTGYGIFGMHGRMH